MKDIQSEQDLRKVSIDQVGVCDLTLPVHTWDPDRNAVMVPATISFSVSLHHAKRGIHMSRLIDLAHAFTSVRPLSVARIHDILKEIREKMQSDSSYFSARWTTFRKKRAPSSKQENYLDYTCGIVGSSTGKVSTVILTSKIPVMSLCPCSLAISKIGAHNQRSYVYLDVLPLSDDWHGQFIDVVEKNVSSDVYSFLKRVDEKHVVDSAHSRPMFAEDIVRNIYGALKKKRYKAFQVTCKNYESIHNHNAFARAGYKKEKLVEHHGWH
jgi:GTP cyclohydrolase IB